MVRELLHLPGMRTGGVIVLAALVGSAACRQKLEGGGGNCGGPDAGSGIAASTAQVSNDARCPATWSATNPAGVPAACTTSGLVCSYPEGQAECALDGSTLKWWTVGATSGCGATAPAVGTACGSPGLLCEYITGPPDGTFTTNYCCDGTRCSWTLEASRGCPNGNACGAIATSDYDQACSVDADCVMEPEGDFCDASQCHCASGVISVSARAQYESDLARRTPTNSFACPCPAGPLPVCTEGRCATAPLTP